MPADDVATPRLVPPEPETFEQTEDRLRELQAMLDRLHAIQRKLDAFNARRPT